MTTLYFYCPTCDHAGSYTSDYDRVVICPDCLGVADCISDDETDMESLLEYMNK